MGKYKQSANTLFNFMKEFEYLKEIIKRGAIVPRYNKENVSCLKLNNLKAIAIPMTCFCDIPLDKIKYHALSYGEFGIAFEKEFCVNNKKVQPIQYVNEESHHVKDFVGLYNSIKKIKGFKNVIENYLVGQLCFMKPLKGQMFKKGNISPEEIIFHDEKEWRFVPITNYINKKEKVPNVLFDYEKENFSEDAIYMYNNLIKNDKGSWFDFDYSDIKYIIVQDKKFRKEIIDIIDELKGCGKNEKYDLVSKIMVLDELKEDL